MVGSIAIKPVGHMLGIHTNLIYYRNTSPTTIIHDKEQTLNTIEYSSKFSEKHEFDGDEKNIIQSKQFLGSSVNGKISETCLSHPDIIGLEEESQLDHKISLQQVHIGCKIKINCMFKTNIENSFFRQWTG